ncbi:DUF3093 domain-containing protein [Streptomyces mobaraensis NBRC 13819 = DSM 40847]|uniref:DUF3093 domain-containing protein n=2 Tax=Streptomyces mobaraensis TaxID=35621 RepID=A0A5N5W798_STRMB|nr:DUF3093 domain-containing protein [Streptomyces mobaraensis]EME98416.1 hypothetical protein H340_21531 [Streptomyces mobaraensis NBRC 13819 = DSM 40847]KAB7844407.1 DUF3093 domain-containing protein [Streptomyces mobaraensis]QTT76126.1 DUF3093 domain-containing protein [Streptomyces mobaraensis NBRC 13819 = DSM 40847]
MQHYEERLTAPRSWWTIAVLIGVACALITLPLGTIPMLGGLVVGGALATIAVSAYGSVRIRVVGDTLLAGDARIPCAALGAAEALDAEGARAWRTHKADSRAFMLLRGYVPTALRIEVTDPADPTPYLYLSTRSPERLAAAVAAGRESAAKAGQD